MCTKHENQQGTIEDFFQNDKKKVHFKERK